MAREKKPLYQPWNEEEFRGDIDVLNMHPIARWCYRTLVQSAFFCSTRPYLPADDNKLWKLAGCESKEQWMKYKASVAEKFTVCNVDGEELWKNKRVSADWDRIVEKREEMSVLAGKAAAARTGGVPIACGERTASARDAHGERTGVKGREVKGSEGKGREEGLPANPPTELLSQDENVRNTPQTSDNQPGTSLQPGDAGYYEEGQYGSLSADKVFRALKDSWQALLGHGAVVKKPFGRQKDWFEQALAESDADHLIPAFEIWASERGKHNPTTQPIVDFLRDNWAQWVLRVEPLNTFNEPPRIFELSPEQIEEERLRQVEMYGDLDLAYYEQKLADKRAAWEEMGHMLDEEQKKELQEEIRELEEKIEEFKAKETQE